MNKELKFDEHGVLLCPECGGNYLHHHIVETFNRGEDEKQGLHTIIKSGDFKGDGKCVDIKHDNLAGNPSWRRHGLRIEFTCEFCSNEPIVLNIAQHKGETQMWWA